MSSTMNCPFDLRTKRMRPASSVTDSGGCITTRDGAYAGAGLVGVDGEAGDWKSSSARNMSSSVLSSPAHKTNSASGLK